MKYEGLLMYALQKGTRQKTHLKKVFQNIVIFNLFHLRYYASYCIVVRTKIYYNLSSPGCVHVTILFIRHPRIPPERFLRLQ